MVLAHLHLNIDIKQDEPSIVDAVIGVIRDHGAEERCLLASFTTRTIKAIRRAGYQGATGCSRGEVAKLTLLPRQMLRGVGGDRVQIPVSYKRVPLATRRMLHRFHALGKAVDFWTIDDPVEARELIRLGADGIMTNDPAALAPLFA